MQLVLTPVYVIVEFTGFTSYKDLIRLCVIEQKHDWGRNECLIVSSQWSDFFSLFSVFFPYVQFLSLANKENYVSECPSPVRTKVNLYFSKWLIPNLLFFLEEEYQIKKEEKKIKKSGKKKNSSEEEHKIEAI